MVEGKKGGEEVSLRLVESLKEYAVLASPYKLLFAAVIALVVALSVLELSEKYLLKVLIDDGSSFFSGVLAKDLFLQVLVVVAIIFVGTVVARAFFFWLRFWILNRLDGAIVLDLKVKYFSHILGLSHKFHSTHRTGSLIARMSRGGRAIEGITDFFVESLLPLLVQLIVVCISLAYLEIYSVAVVIAALVIFLCFVVLLMNRQQYANTASNEADDREKAFIGDAFGNIDTIKFFGKEGYAAKYFEGLGRTSSRAYIKMWDYQGILGAGQTIIIGAGLFFLLYFPLQSFLAGNMTIGSLAFIYTVYLNLAMPLIGFVWGFRRFYEAIADFQSLIDYNKIKNDVVDKPNARNIVIKNGRVDFERVSFTYHKKKIVKDFSLSIKPKEKVAFVGPSGAGKSTLVKLLFRLYDPQEGRILIDGKDVTGFKQESLRSELSIVPQECVLFNDTIFNNVVFARPDATKKEVDAALKAAQLFDFVSSLPQKEETFVGERGIKLSGGERQRLSIARAILAGKKILVLDEATSSLDSETEHKIQQALDNIIQGRTTIMIAHRLSTILKADRIVVIDNGEIAEIGPHSELIKNNGIYARLWKMQKGGYIKD